MTPTVPGHIAGSARSAPVIVGGSTEQAGLHRLLQPLVAGLGPAHQGPRLCIHLHSWAHLVTFSIFLCFFFFFFFFVLFSPQEQR